MKKSILFRWSFVVVSIYFLFGSICSADVLVGGSTFVSNAYTQLNNANRQGGQIQLSTSITFDKIGFMLGHASSTKPYCTYYVKIKNSSCTQIATSSEVNVSFRATSPSAELILFPISQTTLSSGTYNFFIGSSNCVADSYQNWFYSVDDFIAGQNIVKADCSVFIANEAPYSLWLSNTAISTSTIALTVTSSGGGGATGNATTTIKATSTDIGELISYSDGTYTHYQFPFLLYKFVLAIIVMSIMTAVLLIVLKKTKK